MYLPFLKTVQLEVERKKDWEREAPGDDSAYLVN
jgi:hypothetical protein